MEFLRDRSHADHDTGRETRPAAQSSWAVDQHLGGGVCGLFLGARNNSWTPETPTDQPSLTAAPDIRGPPTPPSPRMLRVYLTITSTSSSTGPDATDLGYLLHKHPERAQSLEVTAGRAHVFYPEASAERCTVALLLEVDPVALVRGRGRRGGGRVSCSGSTSTTARTPRRPCWRSRWARRSAPLSPAGATPGRSWSAYPWTSRSHVPAVPCDGDADLVRRPVRTPGLDRVRRPRSRSTRPCRDWGDSRYVDLRLTGSQVLSRALSHLYVLLPVLDGAQALLGQRRRGRQARARRRRLAHRPPGARAGRCGAALAGQRRLVDDAVARLAELDDLPPGRRGR